MVVSFLALAFTHRASAQRNPVNPPRLGAAPNVASTSLTSVTMRNVDFHIGTGVVLRIRRLRGEMHPLTHGVVDFDDVNSYLLDIGTAEVALTGDDLTNLMNKYVFNYPGAPLSHLRVDVTPEGIRQRGTLHKGVDIPFDMTASVSLAPDGRLKLHPTKMKIFDVSGGTLMGALGITLEKLMDLSKAKGISVKGNDLFLDALAVFPPPQIRGTISSVRIEGDRMVQTIGPAADSALPAMTIDKAALNYMHYTGGTLHFGRLYMTDADMLVVDADQNTPFDFDNPNYQKQLVAGRSKTTASLGLEVWMPDASTLDVGRAVPVPKP
ncbi:MAG: hypothetical protein ABI442_09990 [Gemmatimonadaceae bacterium]